MLTPYDEAHMGDILAGNGSWFTAHLLRLCMKADSRNLELIRLGFPEVVAAFEKWRNNE